MGEKTATSTSVEIFGAVYSVRGDHESEHLEHLARVVDERMREIASRVATADTARIAILASLNLADELFQCQRRQEGEREEITERMTALAGTLRDTLEG